MLKRRRESFIIVFALKFDLICVFIFLFRSNQKPFAEEAKEKQNLPFEAKLKKNRCFDSFD